MIEFDLTRWQEELEVAEAFRDQHLSSWSDLIGRLTGPDYRGDTAGPGDPENFVHQYIALILPRIVYDNPKVSITSRTPLSQVALTPKMEAACNSWVRLTDLRTTLSRIATDMLLGFGVGMIANEPRRSMRTIGGNEPWLPRLYRLDPHDFIIDPQATHAEEARYMAHTYRIDHDDLIAKAEVEDGWDLDLVESIGSSNDDSKRDMLAGREGPDRRQVTVYEIWVPEIDTEAEVMDFLNDTNMHSGSIITVIKGQASSETTASYGFAREPRPYYGSHHGPYVIFGCYNVPDDPYPLSPVVSLLPQIADLNDHLRSMTHSASCYKNIIATDSRNQKLANDIRDREDLTVVLVDGLDPSQIVPIEVGGITAQQVTYAGLTQDRLDRVSGIHDAMRGNVTGTATATEVAIAESAAGLRIAHLKREFADAASRVVSAAMWYMFHDGRVSFAIGDEAMALAFSPDGVFVGGTGVGLFEDLIVSIDAMSMERVSEVQQQRRGGELLQVIGTLAQQMVVSPWVDWKRVLSTVGDSINVPELGTILDPKRLQEAVQQMQQQQQQPEAQNQSNGRKHNATVPV